MKETSDDVELISVLAETKAKATEVNVKLVAAQETRAQINEKREQYRPVGYPRVRAVLFCSRYERSQQHDETSLNQFLDLFNASMEKFSKELALSACMQDRGGDDVHCISIHEPNSIW